MFARLFSMVLIAAIIVCPIRCVDGRCGCAPVASGPVEQASCCSHCAAHKSQGKETVNVPSGNVPLENGSHRPDPTPGPLTCQGVCGGAVLEKPCTLNVLETVVFLPLIEEDVSHVSLAQPSHQNGTLRDHHGGKNRGHLLRIEQMSFVC